MSPQAVVFFLRVGPAHMYSLAVNLGPGGSRPHVFSVVKMQHATCRSATLCHMYIINLLDLDIPEPWARIQQPGNMAHEPLVLICLIPHKVLWHKDRGLFAG